MTNKLELSVALNAEDNASAAFKNAADAAKVLAETYRETNKANEDLNKSQKNIDGFRASKKAVSENAAALAIAKEKATQLGKAMALVSEPTKAMAAEFKAAKTAALNLEKQSEKLHSEQKKLRDALKEDGIATKGLAEAQLKLKQNMAATTAAMESQKAKLKAISSAKKRYDEDMAKSADLAGRGTWAMAVGAEMSVPLVAATKSFMQFEDAMAGVAKQVAGARDANGNYTKTYYEMRDSITAMSIQMPIAREELAALVEGGARMGIQGKENLLKFAEVTAQAKMAFNLPAEQLGDDMGKIANLYKIPIEHINQLGDAINYLGDNAQNQGDIIEVLQRMGDVANKLDYKQAAALGSTFLSMGSAPEVAASASKALVRELSMGVDGTKDFKAALKDLGLSASQIQKDMTTDSMGTIKKVLLAAKSLAPEKQTSVLMNIFGKEFGDDAQKLMLNLDMLDKQLQLVRSPDAFGSMAREAASQSKLLSSEVETAQNRVAALSAKLGEKLEPAVRGVLGVAETLLGIVDNLVTKYPKVTEYVLIGAGALSAIAVASGAILLAASAWTVAAGKAKLLTAASGVMGSGGATGLGKKALGFVLGRGGTEAGSKFLSSGPAWANVAAAPGMIGKLGGALKLLGGPLMVVSTGITAIEGTSAYFSAKQDQADEAREASEKKRLDNLWDYNHQRIALKSEAMKGDAKAAAELAAFEKRAKEFGASNMEISPEVIKKHREKIGDTTPVAAPAILAAQKSQPAIKAAQANAVPAVAGEPVNLKAAKMVSKEVAAANKASGLALTNAKTALLEINGVNAEQKKLLDGMKSALTTSGLPAVFNGFGVNIAQGLASGIATGTASAVAAARSMAAQTAEAAKTKLDIHSPSRVFKALGDFVGAGFAQGIEQSPAPVLTTQKMAQKVTESGAKTTIQPRASRQPNQAKNASPNAVTAPVNFTINVNAATSAGASPQSLAETIAAEVRRAMMGLSGSAFNAKLAD